MRRFLPALILTLAACSASEDENVQRFSADDGARIECRIGNAREFERFCTVTRTQTEAGMILTVRKPDGGFRRLRVTDDGRGVVAADGAEPARLALLGSDQIEVAIGQDSFRLPATVQPRR